MRLGSGVGISFMAKRDDKNKELFGTCKTYLIMSVGNTLEQSSDVGCCIELSRTDLKDGILYHGHGGEYLLMVFVLRRNSNRFCFYETNQNIGRLIFAPGKNFEDKKRISFWLIMVESLAIGWMGKCSSIRSPNKEEKYLSRTDSYSPRSNLRKAPPE